MKVICIKNCNDSGYLFNLEIGKIYDVNDIINSDNYRVFRTRYKYYPKYLFKTLSEIRNEKIDKLLEE
jgi:hypothetical protein